MIAHVLASLTFASPLWAGALLAAVAVPVLVHLLSRRHGRPVMFPATRFVRDVQARAVRIRRPRRRWLMALRIAALALIALAFMEPRWQRAAAGPDARAGEHVVVVVDRTGSMQRSERGATLFDEARRRALAELARLNPAVDRASVVILDARPATLLPEPTRQLDTLAARLAALAPTDEHGRLADALARAGELHRRLPADRRPPLRIEIFSDAQASHWPAAPLAEHVGAPAVIHHHALGGDDANLAVRQPRVSPARPVAGQRAIVSVELVNHSDAPAEPTVRLTLGDDAWRQRVELEPRGRATVSFALAFSEPGHARLELSLPTAPGALASDATTGRFVHVREAQPVTLLTRADTADRGAAAYFVARALAPPDDAAEAAGPVALTVAEPTRALALPSDAVVVVVEAGELGDETLTVLRDHLRDGGAVVWVVDDAAAVRSLHALAALAGGATPMTLDDADDAAGGTWGERRIAAGRFDRPALAVFEGPARSALLRASFASTWRGRLTDEAEGLLYFADGAPAVAWRRVGDGRLAVVAADVGPDGGDFARGPAFVPLLHQLIRHVEPTAREPDNPHPGAPLPLTTRDGERLVGPAGETIGDDVAARATRVGPYELRDAATDRRRAGVWVELDPAEADLRRAEGDRLVDTRVAGDGAAAVARSNSALELWPWCVAAGLVLLMVEMAVLGRRGGLSIADFRLPINSVIGNRTSTTSNRKF